jgi:hypothetical protein
MKNKNTSALLVALLLLPFVTSGQDLYLKSEIVPYGVDVLYTAANTIYSVADAPFIVEPGGKAELKAGNRIELNPGFQVLSGGIFFATLESTESIPTDDKESVTVYPNPTEGLINIVSPTMVDVARLLDSNGDKAIEQTEINASAFSMDLMFVKPGIYILEIISGKVMQQIRIEKK